MTLLQYCFVRQELPEMYFTCFSSGVGLLIGYPYTFNRIKEEMTSFLNLSAVFATLNQPKMGLRVLPLRHDGS